MKCVHTFGTGRHKRQADITLLFEYILTPAKFEENSSREKTINEVSGGFKNQEMPQSQTTDQSRAPRRRHTAY